MKLRLDHVLPQPLASNPRPSAVWQQQVDWSGGGQIFVRAPSGTGKTTLVHSLYGLRKDYTGNILWDEKAAAQMTATEWAELRSEHLSVIFQDLRLMPELTAWENLEVKRLLTNTVTEAEAKSWMDRLGIGSRMDKPGRTLSYGEQQRLSIIRALLQPFSWLLMDEPFSHLDDANKLTAASLIDEVAKRNGASILLADLDDNDYFHYSQKVSL